jgi:hypothetical protein
MYGLTIGGMEFPHVVQAELLLTIGAFRPMSYRTTEKTSQRKF